MNELYDANGKEISMDTVLAQVPDGWRDLVFDLIVDLFDLGWEGRVCQIKEKFGGLRLYTYTEIPEVMDRIDQAEEESSRTCIVCGEEATHMSDGWILPYCDEHGKRSE